MNEKENGQAMIELVLISGAIIIALSFFIYHYKVDEKIPQAMIISANNIQKCSFILDPVLIDNLLNTKTISQSKHYEVIKCKYLVK